MSVGPKRSGVSSNNSKHNPNRNAMLLVWTPFTKLHATESNVHQTVHLTKLTHNTIQRWTHQHNNIASLQSLTWKKEDLQGKRYFLPNQRRLPSPRKALCYKSYLGINKLFNQKICECNCNFCRYTNFKMWKYTLFICNSETVKGYVFPLPCMLLNLDSIKMHVSQRLLSWNLSPLKYRA